MRQSFRDGFCLATLVAALYGYGHGLQAYVQSIRQPTVFLIGFWFSWGLALVHEIRAQNDKRWRLTMISGLVVTVQFALAVLAAGFFRDFYVDMVSHLKAMPAEAVDFFGRDLVEAASNRVVGYGGCFGFGLMLVRWLIYARLKGFLSRVFVTGQGSSEVCPCCNQPLAQQR